MNDTHRRLVKARRMIRDRIREGRLFTFLDEGLTANGTIPSTNNLIESWNGRIRDMLRHHRETDARLAANAITDERLEDLYRRAWENSPQGRYETFGIPMRYGTGSDWNDFHTRVEWPPSD